MLRAYPPGRKEEAVTSQTAALVECLQLARPFAWRLQDLCLKCHHRLQTFEEDEIDVNREIL